MKHSLLTKKQWKYVQGLYHLTLRELEVAQLTCIGLNNDAIAKELRIRPGTVKSHLRTIYCKVCIRNKISLLLKFLENINK